MLDYRTHTFLEVYRQRSFTRAAEALLITQPAVSQHIRQLEAHYGCALFTKTGRGVEPTPAANLLYQRLLAMENDEGRLQIETAELAARPTSASAAPLIFGCTRTIADYVAPRLISTHLAAHPDASVTLRAGNTRDLVCALERGEIDFALVEGSFDRSRFAYESLSHEAYVAVAAPRAAIESGIETTRQAVTATSEPAALDAPDALATPGAASAPTPAVSPGTAGVKRPEDAPSRPASIRQLLGQRLILREAGSGTREILEKHLAARDLAVDDFAGLVELESIPTIKACVRAGAGISFMYRAAVEAELEAGELVDITPDDFQVEHDFCLIWQRNSQYAPRYRAPCAAWRS